MITELKPNTWYTFVDDEAKKKYLEGLKIEVSEESLPTYLEPFKQDYVFIREVDDEGDGRSSSQVGLIIISKTLGDYDHFKEIPYAGEVQDKPNTHSQTWINTEGGAIRLSEISLVDPIILKPTEIVPYFKIHFHNGIVRQVYAESKEDIINKRNKLLSMLSEGKEIIEL